MSSQRLRVSGIAATLSLVTNHVQSFATTQLHQLKVAHQCPSHPSTVLQSSTDEDIDDLTESERLRDKILAQIDSGLRDMTGYENFGDPEDFLAADPEFDADTDAIDAATLGQWSEKDFLDKFEYEWDPEKGDTDPNIPSGEFEYLKEVEVDDEGIEVGWDPLYGPSNPFDERTIINPPDSFMIDSKTRDDTMLTPQFCDGDPEADENAKITEFRKSLKIVETHVDPFLKVEVPSHTAKWHGYPEQLSYPKQDYHNNRFTDPKDRTDFDALGPAKARVVAVQMARAKNNEWLPDGVSQAHHEKKFKVFKEKGILTGSTLPGKCDPDIVSKIQPALQVLGDVVELLSIECETVFRFKYHGLIKNKRGMEAWAGVLIRNCDVDCTGVVFETGFRKRDPWYDGGAHWYGPY